MGNIEDNIGDGARFIVRTIQDIDNSFTALVIPKGFTKELT